MTGAAHRAFERRQGENPWLDLLRAAAVTLVVIRHGYRQAGAATQEAGPLHALFLNGWIGVDLFFVLSGFLITRHLLAHGLGTARFDIRRYLTARALRILPAYLVVLVVTAAIAVPPDAREALGLRVLYHLLFLQDYLPANINVVFWTLGVEEKFYLLAPAFVWLVTTRATPGRRVALVAGAFLISPLLRTWIWTLQPGPLDYVQFFNVLRSPFHACLEPLVTGCAAALLLRSGAVSPTRRGPALLAIAALAFALWLASHDMMGTIGPFDVAAQPAVTALLCGGLVLGAALSAGVRMPGEVAGRVVARLSYAIYLVHFPLIGPALALAGLTGAPTAAFWGGYLALTGMVALALHIAVEKPFLRWKDLISAGGRPEAAPPPSSGRAVFSGDVRIVGPADHSAVEGHVQSVALRAGPRS